MCENKLNDECLITLGSFVEENEHVKHVDLSENKITDKGVEIISTYLYGNANIEILDLKGNRLITATSLPIIEEIAKTSCITVISLHGTSINSYMFRQIDQALSIPINQREIPIKSNTKSASKIS